MRIFVPCMEILSPAQHRLWPELQYAEALGFVLYGGTSIALRLGHRVSVDFDFFSAKPLDKSILRDTFPFMNRVTVLQDSPNTLTVIQEAGNEQFVKVSFFGNISHGRVGEPERSADAVMLASSLDDLMATKLKVILQRIEAKDYLDIAALIESGIRLDQGLAAARLFYGKNFQPSESLKALVYFEGGDLALLPKTVKSILVEAVSNVRDLPVVKLKSHDLM